MCPAKTHIRLRIRAVWSESSQCTLWVVKDLRRLQVGSKDSYQTAWICRLIWVFDGRTCNLLRNAVPRLLFLIQNLKTSWKLRCSFLYQKHLYSLLSQNSSLLWEWKRNFWTWNLYLYLFLLVRWQLQTLWALKKQTADTWTSRCQSPSCTRLLVTRRSRRNSASSWWAL